MQKSQKLLVGLAACAVAVGLTASVPAETLNQPPDGFTALFNGKDLSGWRGRKRDLDPQIYEKWSEQERADNQKAFDEDMGKHWRVENGEIVNDGEGVYLTTARDYRDFEFHVDWKMGSSRTDSGIYLRGSPQVQIWDPENREAWKHGADKGSGALWNNNGGGKWPLVKADRPVGQWNTFKIRMIGSRVTVTFNDKLVVDDQVMENYFDRSRPIFATGPIQLQTHGGEMRFRNLFIREITDLEANKILQARNDSGFEPIFNGKDLTGWVGATDSHEVKDGALVFKPGGHGTLYSEMSYSDFAIRFEFQLPPAGNSGLVIRAPYPGEPSSDAMEIQILDSEHPKYTQEMKIKPWQHHGSIYGIVPAHRGYLRPTGQWNFEEVIVKGPRIEVIVNGTTVVDADLSKIKETASGKPYPGRHRTEGRLGWMSHGDPVPIRNIRLKELR